MNFMFEENNLNNKETISKEDFDYLTQKYEHLLKMYNKLNRRVDTIVKLSDKQLNNFSNKIEKDSRMYKRLEVIVKHSDKQAIKTDKAKSALELELEIEKESLLMQEIEETQKEVVYTMGAIGESRSKETGNHVKRVAEYSKCLALCYGLSEHEAEVLKQASPMHDIGKVAIPDCILNKPSMLDEKEFTIMKEHAAIGYEMLKSSKRELMRTAAIVAYEHHEKFDGSGYPRGLSGNKIHIFGRITALADVFDALGSDRVYKTAWDDERIFKFFNDENGKHFDPDLIKIFLA